MEKVIFLEYLISVIVLWCFAKELKLEGKVESKIHKEALVNF